MADSRRTTAIVVLIIWTAVYAVACIPAYCRAGWPPMDHLWEATPFFWLFAIPLVILILPRDRFRRRVLLAYALATSVIDAFVMMGGMTPFLFSWTQWLGSLIFTALLHLILLSVLALLSRLAFYLMDRLAVTRWMASKAKVGIVVLAVVYPFAYRAIATASDANAGRQKADQDWADRKAGILTREPEVYHRADGFDFVCFFDAESGLELKQSWFRNYEPGYNAEVQHLLSTRGIPAWSLKSHFVSDADMIAMLNSPNVKKITSYPYNVSPNIVLFRGGGTTPWGTTIGSDSQYLDIQSRNHDDVPLREMGEEKVPAFIGHMAKYPGVYFIRCGTSVVTCTEDGWVVEQICRFP